jgi:hypothetical protein
MENEERPAKEKKVSLRPKRSLSSNVDREEEGDAPLGTSSIRRNDNSVLDLATHRLTEVLKHRRFGVELWKSRQTSGGFVVLSRRRGAGDGSGRERGVRRTLRGKKRSV